MSVITLITAFFVSSCGSQPVEESYPVPESFYSQQCYLTQGEGYIWLEQEEEWLALPENSRQQFEQARINWLEDNVMIVGFGQKPSAGFEVKLTHWLMEPSHWQVVRQLNTPNKGRMQAAMITSPCVLVKIPKTIKTFTLKNEQGAVLGRWMH